MNTLFIDTTTDLLKIAIIGTKNIIKEQISKNSHSIYTLPLIEETLQELNLDLKNIDNIVVVTGPGSFTGIRIGLSISKTISYTLKKPIYTVSSLELMHASNENLSNKLAVIEDTKGYYMSIYDMNNKPIVIEQYVTNIDEYKEKYTVLPVGYDVEKVVKYALTKKPINVFEVKANYVKTIEVMNDKR